jgi:hypothetical protein
MSARNAHQDVSVRYGRKTRPECPLGLTDFGQPISLILYFAYRRTRLLSRVAQAGLDCP